MRTFLLILIGITIGFWGSWPGIFIPRNWKCFKDIIAKSADDKISVKAALAVSPSYLLNKKNKSLASKIRIVNDACFR
tara:strand:- start:577 stop:810 length:234 start_codon:yes stop_codon:yes gene_type:complete